MVNSPNTLRIVYLFVYAASASWYPFFSVFLKDRGLSGTQIGLVFSMVPLMMLLALPVWGMAADQFGRKRVMLFLVSAVAISAPGFTMMNDFMSFLLWTAFFSVVYNPIAPLVDSLALDHVAANRNTSFGRLRIWGSVGWGVATPLVGWFVTGKDTGLVFVIAAALMAVSFLIGFMARNGFGHTPVLRLSRWDLLSVLRNKPLFIFLGLIVCIAVGRIAMWNFYSVYLRDIGANNQLIGMAFGIQAASELPVLFFAGAIIARAGLHKVMVCTLAAMAVRMTAYTFISNPVWALVIDISHGLTFGLFLVACVEFVNTLVPQNLRATGQALFWAGHFGAGAILGNTMAGVLCDMMGVKQMYLVCAGIITFGMFATFFWSRSGSVRSEIEGCMAVNCHAQIWQTSHNDARK